MSLLQRSDPSVATPAYARERGFLHGMLQLVGFHHDPLNHDAPRALAVSKIAILIVDLFRNSALRNDLEAGREGHRHILRLLQLWRLRKIVHSASRPAPHSNAAPLEQNAGKIVAVNPVLHNFQIHKFASGSTNASIRGAMSLHARGFRSAA